MSPVEWVPVKAGPEHEAARLSELAGCVDIDAPQGPDVDAIVTEAAQLAGVPMATLNLLDAERQCQVSTVGFDGGVTRRSEAMCEVALELGTFLHVPDARLDERFAHSPWVDGRLGEVRFYATAPLITPNGYVLGTLCVFDIERHELSADQIRQLEQLASRAVAALARADSPA